MHQVLMLGAHHEGRVQAAEFLRQEIAFFETRLHELGEQGRAHEERALRKVYKTLLRERRGQLADL